ncbi:hypothetical protein OAE93_00215 [bacterium]|nr:hypothetical protein [bacterium]
MKNLFLVLILIANNPLVNAQVMDLTKSNQSAEQVEPVAYDGSYLKFDSYKLSKAQKLGLAGEAITILRANYVYVLDTVNQKNISTSDVGKLQGKQFTIENYRTVKSKYGSERQYFLVKNAENAFLIEDASGIEFIINAYLDPFRKKYLGRSFVPLHNDVNVKDIYGKEFKLSSTNSITVTDVQYAKLSIVEYGMVMFFDNGLIVSFPMESYHQPDEKELIKVGNLTGVLLIDVAMLDKFISDNQPYSALIREKKIKVGMTKRQVTLSWGSYRTGYKKIAGYDEVMEYDELGTLYLKSGILKLIN